MVLERLQQARTKAPVPPNHLQLSLAFILLGLQGVFHMLSMYTLYLRLRTSTSIAEPRSGAERRWFGFVLGISVMILMYTSYHAYIAILQLLDEDTVLGDTLLFPVGSEIVVLGLLVALKVWWARVTLVTRLLLWSLTGIAVAGACGAWVAMAGEVWGWWDVPEALAKAPYFNDRIWFIGVITASILINLIFLFTFLLFRPSLHRPDPQHYRPATITRLRILLLLLTHSALSLSFILTPLYFGYHSTLVFVGAALLPVELRAWIEMHDFARWRRRTEGVGRPVPDPYAGRGDGVGEVSAMLRAVVGREIMSSTKMW